MNWAGFNYGFLANTIKVGNSILLHILCYRLILLLQQMSKKAAFTSDIEFCPDCGTILPLPGLEDVVTCTKCSYQVDVIGKVNSGQCTLTD